MNRRHFLFAGACAICTGRAAAIPPDSLPTSQLESAALGALQTLAGRLRRLRTLVGYARFNLIDLPNALKLAARHPQVGEFERAELALLERFFQVDPRQWGFHGPRVSDDLNQQIAYRDVHKIRGSGHYLLRGAADALFSRLREDVGESLRLTSGVRNLLKQTQLFCDKLLANHGDLSATSRWVAPPGFSYHAAGDFDVGVTGLGRANFTAAFLQTEESQRIAELKYAVLRYPANNPWGVMHEPWHIQVS